MTRSCLLILVLLVISLAIAACGSSQVTPEKIKPTATPSTAPTLPSTEAVGPVTPTAAPLLLSTYPTRWYELQYPANWLLVDVDDSEGSVFAPVGETTYGLRIRFIGSGYTFSVLDALINGEVDLMRQEGLLPQELGIRRSDQIPAGAAGRTAEFSGVVEGTPVRLQVTAIAANFSGAYLLRSWVPQTFYDQGAYPVAYARIVTDFVPIYNPEPTPTPAIADPPTFTPEVVLSEQTYQHERYTINYPIGWSPTVNLDNSVTFLSNEPGLLVGVDVRVLGLTSDPANAPSRLLDEYFAEVSRLFPDAIIGEQRLEETIGDVARGISGTYVIAHERGRLVYRATLLVSLSPDGTAYRIVQWADERIYEAGYRDVYRAIVAGFRPVAVEPLAGEDS